MRFLKPIGVRLLAAVLAFTFVPAAMPEGTPLVGVSKAEAQYRYYEGRGGWHGGRRYYRPGGYYGGGRGYYGGRHYGGRRWYRDRYYRRHNGGAAVAAGIIGLGVGAAIANSARPRYYERPAYRGGLSARDRYCLSRYRSYDVYSKTYQPYNGPRRVCR